MPTNGNDNLESTSLPCSILMSRTTDGNPHRLTDKIDRESVSDLIVPSIPVADDLLSSALSAQGCTFFALGPLPVSQLGYLS